MKKILIPTKLESIAADILKAKGYDVICDDKTPILEQAKQHPDTYALIVRSEKVGADELEAFPSLKLVVRAGAGFDTIDIAYARKKGIDVMNTPGANANAVAEEVIALALAQYRHIIAADTSTRSGKWEKKNFMGSELTGKVIGIVGLGNIGSLVAKRLSGFEVEVLGYDPVLSRAKAQDMGIELCSLQDIFSKADIITLHVPGGEQTRNMVDKELLSLLKPGALLINCARAGVVNEDALRALKNGALEGSAESSIDSPTRGSTKGYVPDPKLIYYLNDVYPEDKAGDKPVADIADIMLPHLGASTLEANLTAARRSAEQIIDYTEHGISTYVVNKGIPDGLDPVYQYLAYCLSHTAAQYLNGAPIRMIECTFHGELEPFSQWFWAPILAGLSPEVDRGLMPKDALGILGKQGVAVHVRSADAQEQYGKSMTIDIIADQGAKVRKVSLRGTLVEGIPMISRFNQFERLYFDLPGNSLVFVYKDRPGVLAQITRTLAEHEVNIDNANVPRDSKTNRAMACLKINKAVPKDLVARIERDIDASSAFFMTLV